MSQPLLPPGFIYKSELGSGGTARVVCVTWEHNQKTVALKLPLPSSNDPEQTFPKLAEREWQLIGGFSYPGLVRLLKISTNPEEYIILELCYGPTLDSLGQIKNNNSAINIFSALAINLEFLKLQNIIHGDLKPHNYFLPSDWESITQTDRLFFTKLSDFSLGKFSNEPDTNRMGAGTVGYLAPETISENITTFQSDLFALGVIAYQMFTGIHPFMEDENDPVKINSRCLEETPTPIKELNPDINDNIIDIIDSLLAKNPSDRPKSGWDVCIQLEKAGASYPFRKALRPSLCLSNTLPFEDNTNMLNNISSQKTKRLSIISNNQNHLLRLVLSHNFDKKNLFYNGHKFCFRKNILWPHRLRKLALEKYIRLSITGKKDIVKAGIVGSINNCQKLGIINDDKIDLSFSDAVTLIRQFISIPSYKRLSPSYASIAEEKGYMDIASELYLQYGELSRASECAYQIATTLHSEHKSIKALEIIRRVINLANTTEKLFDIRRLLMLQGDIYKDMGEAENALTVYEKIISIYKDNEPDKILAETYKDLGDLYKVKRQFDKGIESLNIALEIYYLLDDELEISHTLNNMGNIYWIASNFDKALFNYRKALKIQRHLDVREDIASTLSNIASIYALKGFFKKGIRILNLSLKLKKEIGNKVEIARTLNNLGYCYNSCGNQYKAINCLTESLDLNRQVGNKKEILFNLENLTALMITAGQLKESLNYLKEGISISDQVSDENHFGIFQLNMATVLRRMGQYGQAEKCLKTINEIVDNSDDISLKIMLMNARASIRLAIGDNKNAERILIDAKSLADEIDNRPDKLNTLLILTKINNSDSIIQETHSLVEELSLSREKVLLSNNMLRINIDSGKVNTCGDLVDEIENTLNSMNEDIEIAGIYLNLAEYYLLNNNCDKAFDFANLGSQKAISSNLNPEMIRANILLGKIQFSEGEYEACFDNFKKGMKLTQQISAGLLTEEDKKIFQNHRVIRSLLTEINKLKEQTVH